MTPAARIALAALAATLPAALVAPASASETISLPPFKSVEIHGGGHVILRHGDVQKVTLIKGDRGVAEIRVQDGDALLLSPCRRMCWGTHELEVEVVTPAVTALSVHGGGEIDAQPGFGTQPALSVEAHGGGTIDARNIAAADVSADVHGGGSADVRAEKSLHAEVYGGGEVRYWGHPSVSSEIHGGGSINGSE